MSQEEKAPASSLVAFHSDSHQLSILSGLDHLRKQELLCDVTLVVQDVSFKAHKALLAASSRYFSAMFTAEGRILQSTCRLDGVAAETFAAVLEFIYSARVSVQEDAAEQLLAAARLMEVRELVKVLTASTEDVKPAEAPAAVLLKRRRGRPKKDARPGTSEEPQARDAGETGPADHDPGDDPRRHSKRKIRPPVKYKSYKVGGDAAGSKEPGKKGCKRKYPNTEARCQDCGKVFKHHLFLKIHQRTHTGEKPFHCLVCGKSFTQKHTLLAHQRIHTGEKPFICSVCSKALSTKHSLQEHMNLHEGEKSYDCDKCGKTFSQKKQLKSHYRVHTGKSLPECDLCHHKFMDAAQLKKHLRTHTGEKPFTCEICGKCFTAKSTLQTHIRIHRGEKPFDCPLCGKLFSDPSARRRHIASHSGKKPFICSSCSLSFTRLDNLKTHAKTHSKERAGPPDGAGAGSSAGAPGPRYQPPLGPEQIQLVVTQGDIAFVPGQDQDMIVPAQPSGQNVAVVSQGDTLAPAPAMQPLGMLGNQPEQPEQMHIITLSKEAMEQLQGPPGPPGPPHRPVQQLQVLSPPLLSPPLQPPAGGRETQREPHGQAIHVSSQAGQPISISQTSQQISGHHIQGQTFQIQAGTVSYLYTTGLQDG